MEPWIEREHPTGLGGVQKVYKFKNGYGASVVRFYGSYGFESGLWELAVLEFKGDDWQLTYKTPVTSDVIGYLQWSQVEEVLKEIEALPPLLKVGSARGKKWATKRHKKKSGVK